MLQETSILASINFGKCTSELITEPVGFEEYMGDESAK